MFSLSLYVHHYRNGLCLMIHCQMDGTKVFPFVKLVTADIVINREYIAKEIIFRHIMGVYRQEIPLCDDLRSGIAPSVTADGKLIPNILNGIFNRHRRNIGIKLHRLFLAHINQESFHVVSQCGGDSCGCAIHLAINHRSSISVINLPSRIVVFQCRKCGSVFKFRSTGFLIFHPNRPGNTSFRKALQA